MITQVLFMWWALKVIVYVVGLKGNCASLVYVVGLKGDYATHVLM